MNDGRLCGCEAGDGSGGSQAAIGSHDRCADPVGEFDVAGVAKPEVLAAGKCTLEERGEVEPSDRCEHYAKCPISVMMPSRATTV